MTRETEREESVLPVRTPQTSPAARMDYQLRLSGTLDVSKAVCCSDLTLLRRVEEALLRAR